MNLYTLSFSDIRKFHVRLNLADYLWCAGGTLVEMIHGTRAMRTSTFSVESLVQLTYISFISDIGQCCMGFIYCKTIIKNLHTRLGGEEGIKGAIM